MTKNIIKGINVRIDLDHRSGKRSVKEVMPLICREEDYFKQYLGIWKVMFDTVKELDAKAVLEFGTRDGYSTRLFAEALKQTKGDVYTVDINPPVNDLSEFENIHVITSDIKNLDWSMPVDILFIDDWHNPWHLYSELDKFAKWARVIMIHDVSQQDTGLLRSLLTSVENWCHDNMMIYTIYPMNGCGLAVIKVEKSRFFYADKNETTSEQGGE